MDLSLARLETERLLLRPQQAEEAAVYHQLWAERDPRVPPHRRLDAQGRPTVADIAERIRAAEPESSSQLLAVERRDTGEVIGYCGLAFGGNAPPGEPELAYELLRAHHGCGYATEAARAVRDWAAENGCPRLWAGVWDWNVASRRVLHKLGFTEHSRAETDPAHGTNLLTVCELDHA